MDLVQVAESVAKSPFGLPLFLMAVVYYTVMMIQKKDKDLNEKDQQMKLHFEDDLKKAEKREKWYQGYLEWFQKYLESNTKQMTDIGNDVKDIEAFLLEGRVHFEPHENSRDDEVTPYTVGNDSGMLHLRRKLSSKGSE
jgi:hypothetical protein